MSTWPDGSYITPRRARRIRLELELERADAIRAQEVTPTAGELAHLRSRGHDLPTIPNHPEAGEQ